MDKAAGLKALEAEMAGNAELPLEANLVFGEGHPEAKVVFIGEAPGETEDRLKRPFVGRGGELLRECIREIGWKEEDVYITNIVKRRPPENRDPSPEEILAYGPYLKRQIDILQPPVIVTLGRFAMSYFLPQAKISRDEGKIFKIGGRCIIPMFHPAAALRTPEVMHRFRSTFVRLPAMVRKCEEVLSSPAAKEISPKPSSLF